MLQVFEAFFFCKRFESPTGILVHQEPHVISTFVSGGATKGGGPLELVITHSPLADTCCGPNQIHQHDHGRTMRLAARGEGPKPANW